MKNSQGFITMLIGSNRYSTERAKWFCQTAELILNIIIALVVLYMVWGIIKAYQIHSIIGNAQLKISAQLFLYLIAGVIFGKLNLMAVGALINISELIEKSGGLNSSNSLNVSSRPSGTYNFQKEREKTYSSKPIADSSFSSSSTNKQEPLFDLMQDEFEMARAEAIIKLTSAGHFVNTIGEYPAIKWEIIFSNGKTKKLIYNITDLIEESKKFGS